MAGRDTLPATFETPPVWPYLLGRPVVVQASPLLSVTLIGVPRSL